ncbi:hypothetical protein J6Z48_01570 [bacterium]|nr:hypothetical protein [bacterium]
MPYNLNSKNSVLFFEDYSARELREGTVGRKGLSLFRLKGMDVPVPEFFVISGNVFSEFCFNALEGSQEKLLAGGRNPEEREIEELFSKCSLPQEVEEEIASAYARLSGFTDAWVSVRSSVVFPEKEDVSFNGIFSTELNVRKYDELIASIKRIYASMFSDDVVAYASKMGVSLSSVRLAVVVQRMVQSEISGVSFTVDPITLDKTKLSIEAVYGLGDVIAQGEITPDSYLLDKKNLSVIEKHIAPQEWMKVRSVKQSNKQNPNIEKITISPNYSHRQKLSDRDLEEIAKISLVIEDKSRDVQNIEWVMSGGRFWILQNKPLNEKNVAEQIIYANADITEKNLREVILKFIENRKSATQMISTAMKEAQKLVEHNNDETNKRLEKLIYTAKKNEDTQLKESSTQKEDYILTGIGASFGTASGIARVVDKPIDKEKINRKTILIIKEYSTEMEAMILASGGIIMDAGGITSDTALLCREFAIPAIVGAQSASTLINTGDYIRMDGNSGVVYREKLENIEQEQTTVQPVQKTEDGVHPVVKAYSTEEIKQNISAIQSPNVEDLTEKVKKTVIKKEKTSSVPPKDKYLLPTATQIFSLANDKPKDLFEYVGNASGIVYVDLDKIMLEDGKHILKYAASGRSLEYARKISNKILEYVDLAKGEDVVISIGSSTVKEFRSLVGGKQLENPKLSDDVYGIVHYLNNIRMLRLVLKIVKRIRNVYKRRNVSIAIHAPMNEDMMRAFKRQLSGEKLRRMESFKVYAILDNPGEVLLAGDIVSTKIDGLIINMPRIARQMQGFEFNDKSARYDLARNSVFRVLDNVISVIRNKAERIIVVVEDSKPLLKYCVRAGVYGVCVSPKHIKEAREVASGEERNIILGK